MTDTPTRLGRYQDLVLLGEGGMGAVYRARDPALDRVVAIKVVTSPRPEFLLRFRREARAIAKLSHPNIVAVHDFGEDEHGNPYFVMELLPGQSLDKVIAERGPLPAELVADLLRQACEGLAAAHAQDIVHRDVKPANLVVDSQFRLKLVDFGIAHVDEGGDALTRPQSLMGTPHYMAPEMLRGERIDGRADIYALGLTGFHLLAGKPPFEAPSSIAVTVMQLSEPLPDLAIFAPATPPTLRRLIERMAAKDREQRPASCREIADALTRFLKEPVVDAPARAPRRNILIAAGSGVLLASIAVGGMVRGPHRPTPVHAPARPPGSRQGSGEPPVPPPPGTGPTTPPPSTMNAAAHQPLRVAVLKFKNLGGDPALDLLTEGIGETALTSLAGIAGLQLVERNQADQAIQEIDFGQTRYVDRSTAAALGAMTGVEVAVQGGYQKASGAVRVSARTVRVATGEILDTFNLTRPADNLFDLQDAVAAELRKRLVALAAAPR